MSLYFTYRAKNQIDALAIRPDQLTSSSGGSKAETLLLAVTYSALEGNEWSGGVALLNVHTGKRIRELQMNSGIGALAWCGETHSELLALGCDNGDIQLLQVHSNENEYALSSVHTDQSVGHDDIVTGVEASRFDKTLIATSSWDLTIKLWDLNTMDKTVAVLEGHTDLIWDLSMSCTRAHILSTASQDCTLQVWDDRDLTPSSSNTLHVSFPALSVDWHPTQEYILSAGLEDGSIVTFDTRNPSTPLAHTLVHQSPVHTIQYSPYHKDLLATGGDDKCTYLMTNTSTSTPSISSVPTSDSDYIRALAWFRFNQNDCFLTTGSWSQAVQAWKINL